MRIARSSHDSMTVTWDPEGRAMRHRDDYRDLRAAIA